MEERFRLELFALKSFCLCDFSDANAFSIDSIWDLVRFFAEKGESAGIVNCCDSFVGFPKNVIIIGELPLDEDFFDDLGKVCGLKTFNFFNIENKIFFDGTGIVKYLIITSINSPGNLVWWIVFNFGNENIKRMLSEMYAKIQLSYQNVTSCFEILKSKMRYKKIQCNQNL